MNLKQNSQQLFDETAKALRTAIFTPQRNSFLEELYGLKKRDLAHHQKPLFDLFLNLKYFTKGDYQTFVRHQEGLLDKLHLQEEHQFFKQVGKFYLAIAFNILGKYKLALPLMQEVASAAEDKGYERLSAEVDTGLGHIFSEFGYLRIALLYFEKSQQYAFKNQLENLIINNGFGLVKLYVDDDKMRKASLALEQISPCLINTDTLPLKLNFLRWEIDIAIRSKDWDKASSKLEVFNQTKQDFFNPYFFISIYLIEAKIATHHGLIEDAIILFEKAIATSKDINSDAALSIVYRDIATVLTQSEAFEKASGYLKDSLDLAMKMESKIALTFTYHKMYELAVLKKETVDALEAFRLYHHYHSQMNEDDEKLNNEMIKSVAMFKEQTKIIDKLTSELHRKSDDLQVAQYVLTQKKQLLSEVDTLMQHIKQDNRKQNKDIVTIQKRMHEANIFERSKDNLTSQISAEIQKWCNMLSSNQPNLTKTELRVCYYTFKFLSNKEIASILFTTTKNVEQHKFRIKKKIGFDQDIALSDYLHATFG